MKTTERVIKESLCVALLTFYLSWRTLLSDIQVEMIFQADCIYRNGPYFLIYCKIRDLKWWNKYESDSWNRFGRLWFEHNWWISFSYVGLSSRSLILYMCPMHATRPNLYSYAWIWFAWTVPIISTGFAVKAKAFSRLQLSTTQGKKSKKQEK